MTNICRACLEISDKVYPLFGEIVNVDVTVAFMLNSFTSFTISENDGLPRIICIPCFKTIRIAYNFHRQFTKTQNILQKKLAKEIDQAKEIEFSIEEDDQDDIAEDMALLMQGITDQPEIEETNEEIIMSSDEDSEHFLQETLHSEVDLSNIEVKTENVELPKNNLNKTSIKNVTILREYDDLKAKFQLKYECPKCLKKFTMYRMFFKHILKHTEGNIVCNICVKEFNSKGTFLDHFKDQHRYECTGCRKTFQSKNGVDFHFETVHKKNKKLKCPHENCKKSFLLHQQLERHQQSHSESNNFLCSICGAGFKTYDMFRYHTTRTHENRLIRICQYCGKKFLQYTQFKDHMWQHTGIKRHSCQRCGKQYARKTQLNKHWEKYCGKVKKGDVTCI